MSNVVAMAKHSQFSLGQTEVSNESLACLFSQLNINLSKVM